MRKLPHFAHNDNDNSDDYRSYSASRHAEEMSLRETAEDYAWTDAVIADLYGDA